jgi:GPH family glycoside/pentoside/hexuronide:cation symporter
MFGNLFASGILIPLIVIYGDPTSYVRAVAIACLVLAVSLIAFIPGMHETEEIKERYLRIHAMMEKQKMPYFKLLKIAFKNKPFVVYVTMFTLWITGTFMWQFSQLYIIREVLNLEITVMAPAMLLFMAFFLPFLFIFTYIAKKTEHIYVSIMAILIVAVDLVLVMFITNTLGFYIVNILFGIGSAAWGGILFSITSDVMDSVCIDAEQHVESTMIGIRTFFLRIAYLAGGGIIAIVHIMTGYIPGATSQSPSAQLGLRLHAGLIPAIMLFVAAILVIKFYDLKGDKKRECLELLRAKGL